jgi:hypothetical protein
MQRIEEAKVMVNNKNELHCSNELILEMKKKVIKICIWSIAVYVSETWTPEKKEERVINAFETWYWRRILK